jgi:hypothetical protein
MAIARSLLDLSSLSSIGIGCLEVIVANSVLAS